MLQDFKKSNQSYRSSVVGSSSFPLSDITNLGKLGSKTKSFKPLPESFHNLIKEDFNVKENESNYEEAGENGMTLQRNISLISHCKTIFLKHIFCLENSSGPNCPSSDEDFLYHSADG